MCIHIPTTYIRAYYIIIIYNNIKTLCGVIKSAAAEIGERRVPRQLRKKKYVN